MTFHNRLRPAASAAAATLGALLAACSSPPPAPVAQAPQPEAPMQAPASDGAQPSLPPPVVISQATNARTYRTEAASHIYRHNADRIYKGKLPPLLYAIGVLQVEVDARGQVTSMKWMRAPSHAPEVVREIERTVRAAAPFPVPQRLGRVVYTDTWLWHKSGQFQLDTLTEGQL